MADFLKLRLAIDDGPSTTYDDLVKLVRASGNALNITAAVANLSGNIALDSIGNKYKTVNYYISEWATNRIGFSRDIAGASNWDFFTNAGDGSEANTLVLYGVGNETLGLTDREGVTFGFTPTGVDRFFIGTVATGTGSHRPVEILVGANAGQIYLNTDGSVDFFGDIEADGISSLNNVSALGSVSGAEVHADNGFSGSWVNNEGDTVTVEDGIITDVSAP